MGKKVHFLGIGGSGASAAAAIAEAAGFEVTGCDLAPHNEFTTIFKPDQLLTGHHPKHLSFRASQTTSGKAGNVDILAVTPAIFSFDPDNPELLEAKKKNIPIMTWQEFLGKYLAKEKYVIAVAGTHGKTTTTAMIGLMLEDAGLDPTVALGGIVPKWNANYRVGKRRPVLSGAEGYFVVEADEFNDNFLSFKPDIAVVTNIEMDHPEYFKDFSAVRLSFRKFLEGTKQKIIANLSDPDQILNVHPRGVTIIDYSKHLIDFPLQIPGQFNEMNASAAFQVGLALGINTKTVKKSLQNYKGVGRRFEYIGEYNKARVYSDFGHHPTEIKVTIEAARQVFLKKKILLIFQPHMYSRTKALFNDFVKVFRQIPVDKTFIMDIYPSREIDTGSVTSKQLVEAINKPSISHPGGVTEVLGKIKPEIKKGDIVFFMSAGDTDKLAKELVSLK